MAWELCIDTGNNVKCTKNVVRGNNDSMYNKNLPNATLSGCFNVAHVVYMIAH